MKTERPKLVVSADLVGPIFNEIPSPKPSAQWQPRQPTVSAPGMRRKWLEYPHPALFSFQYD